MTDAQRLADAEAKLHALRTTGGIVEISTKDGGKVAYQPADANDLEAYIARLRAGMTGRPRRGAIGVRF